MSELQTNDDVETEEFVDELSDEALDRQESEKMSISRTIGTRVGN